MRFLGFLFLIVLILVGVGYCRGWFSVSTTHAGSNDGVTVGVDTDRIDRDIKNAGNRIGELSAQAVEKLRRLGQQAGSDTEHVDGTVASVDTAARDLVVTAGAERIDLHVPAAVAVTQDGKPVEFAALQAGRRVRLVMKESGDTLLLQRVELLP